MTSASTSAQHTPQVSQQLATLNENFGLPGVLAFEVHPGTELIRAQVTLPGAAATVYLHGAHLALWQPAGQQPVLFLSERSSFTPDKAIRGGIPICFPWFGARADGKPGPAHGFARTAAWEVSFAALVPDEDDSTLHLSLNMGPSGLSRSFGFDHFRIACEFRFGRTLELRLSVVNLGSEPLHFEEALHSYFHVRDVRQIALEGLGGAQFLDKTDGFKPKTDATGALTLTGETDRVYPGNRAEVRIVDKPLGRTIAASKENSATTVVWNPWKAAAAKLADLPADAWPAFVCVEAANTGENAITLAPSQLHTMTLKVALSEA